MPLKNIVILLISLALTGCGVFDVETAVERIEPPTATSVVEAPTETPTTETVVEEAAPSTTGAASAPSLEATYRDTYAGLALNYPGDWEITTLTDDQKAASTTYAATFQSWVSGPAGGGGIPEGGAKVDLVVSPDGTLTLEEAMNQRRDLLQGPASDTKILSEEPVTLATGLEGVRLRTESNFGEAEQVVTIINGHLVIFSGLGDETMIETILQTLRPLDETAEAAFEPYPARPTDVQAIRVADGTQMAAIYSGPGDTFPQVTAVQSGMALTVSGITEDAQWYQLAGCGEQNPFRPAPSCWISTDLDVAEPIRAITPSQQPVLPTEKQAVLIVAPDMAPIYSGPATTYPFVAQLAGGFSFNITGSSEDGQWWRLAKCSSPLNEPLAECWVSADPAVTEALDELMPHGPQSAAAPLPEEPLRTGTTTLTELPQCFNLDMGQAGSLSNPNCEFNLHPAETNGTLILEPLPPARFGFSGVFPETPTEAMCAGSPHLQGSSEVIAPLATLYVCYQTGEGRFGYLHFLEMRDTPLAVTLEWHTFGE